MCGSSVSYVGRANKRLQPTPLARCSKSRVESVLWFLGVGVQSACKVAWKASGALAKLGTSNGVALAISRSVATASRVSHTPGPEHFNPDNKHNQAGPHFQHGRGWAGACVVSGLGDCVAGQAVRRSTTFPLRTVLDIEWNLREARGAAEAPPVGCVTSFFINDELNRKRRPHSIGRLNNHISAPYPTSHHRILASSYYKCTMHKRREKGIHLDEPIKKHIEATRATPLSQPLTTSR